MCRWHCNTGCNRTSVTLSVGLCCLSAVVNMLLGMTVRAVCDVLAVYLFQSSQCALRLTEQLG